jgi:hypothetical protein
MNTKPFRAAGCFLAMAMLLVVALPELAQAAPARHGLDQAPAGLIAAITRTEAREAATNPAYAIGKNGCARIQNGPRAPALAGCFGRHGPAFRAGKEKIDLHLAAWGRPGRLQPVTLTRSAPQANRIEYRGRHIAEWWRVLPLGYEQGFTLNAAPAGTGKVVLQLTASRAPTLEHGTLAWGALRYGKLHVTDANGKVLPATLSAQGRTITLTFDAVHARYPVRVDPLVWVEQEVTANDGAAYDFFGDSVALSGDGKTALVGAYYKSSHQGAAYVYTLANGAWSQAAELTASDGATRDHFGKSVALSSTGTTALVGVYNKTVGGNSEQGAAYFFGSSDLSAVLSAPATVAPNGQFTSQYILTNRSTTASAPLVVVLPVPAANAAYVSQTASQGTCT